MSTTTEPTPQARLHTIGAVCERLRSEFPDISISKIRYLEDQGLLRPRRTRGGYRLFSESDVEIAAACGRLARHGLDARHLRAFRTAAGRQSALLEQLVATGLRSRDLERRRAALDELQTLAGVAIELAQHLLVRDLREASER